MNLGIAPSCMFLVWGIALKVKIVTPALWYKDASHIVEKSLNYKSNADFFDLKQSFRS
jgi:hypothetical protein